MITISFKALPEEVAGIRAEASRRHLSLSEYLRRVAVPQKKARRRPVLKRSPRTGSLVLISPPGTPPLTSDRVKQLLEDYP